MAEKVTGRSEILKYMQTHDFITDEIARAKFGVHRLSDVIFCFRNRGHIIETVMVDSKNRYGNSCKYARYFLKE